MTKAWSHKFLLALSMALIFMLNFAYAGVATEYELAGSVKQMLESEGILYLKMFDDGLLPGGIYRYDPDQDARPVLFIENVPESETLVVVHGSPYLQKNFKSSKLELIDSKQDKDAVPSFDLFPHGLPFEAKKYWIVHSAAFDRFLFMSIAFDGKDVYRLFRYDLDSGLMSVCKSYDPLIFPELYAFSPISADETLFVRRVPLDLSVKEPDYITQAVLYNWITETEQILASLPLRTSAFAYDRSQEMLYYLGDDSLFSVDLSGSITEIQKNVPEAAFIMVQNASIIKGHKFCFISLKPNSDGSAPNVTLHVWALR